MSAAKIIKIVASECQSCIFKENIANLCDCTMGGRDGGGIKRDALVLLETLQGV
jgi:hypothetical protein